MILHIGHHDPKSWLQLIGGLHFIFLHFPIALITMTVISELCFAWTKNPFYSSASRLLLIGAAIFAVPTAVFGLIYRFGAAYHGEMGEYVWWHMWFGLATTLLAIMAVFLREKSLLYYPCLLLLFLLVIITGYLGGGMTFGLYQIDPPYW